MLLSDTTEHISALVATNNEEGEGGGEEERDWVDLTRFAPFASAAVCAPTASNGESGENSNNNSNGPRIYLRMQAETLIMNTAHAYAAHQEKGQVHVS